MTPKPPTQSTAYQTLVQKTSKEFDEMERVFKNRLALGHWRVGRWIHEHILEHKDRADYGDVIIKNLEKDVGRDSTTLTRSLQFYRAYPIHAAPHQLTWEHYRNLITVKDEKERKKLEKKVIENNWNTKELRKYLKTKRELSAPDTTNQPIPQLKFTRGKLHTYQIIKANKPLSGRSPLVLDLGFRQEYVFPQNASQFKEGDFAELLCHSEERSDEESNPEILRFAQNDRKTRLSTNFFNP